MPWVGFFGRISDTIGCQHTPYIIVKVALPRKCIFYDFSFVTLVAPMNIKNFIQNLDEELQDE